MEEGQSNWNTTIQISNKTNVAIRNPTKLKTMSLPIYVLCVMCFFTQLCSANTTTDNVCFDITVPADYFCAGAIGWKLSQTVYDELKTRDDAAKASYQEMLVKWKDVNDETVDNDCLAIARSVICPYHIPSCGGTGKEEQPLCKFMCSLWGARCPNQKEFMCERTSKEST